MISETDIKDWDFEQLRIDVDILGDNNRLLGEREMAQENLNSFLNEVHALVRESSPQIAALFKPFKE